MVPTDSSYSHLPALNRAFHEEPAQAQASASAPAPATPASYPTMAANIYPSPTQMASPHVSPYGPPGQPYPTPPQAEPAQEGQSSNQYPQYSYDIQLRYPEEPMRPYPPPQHDGLPLPSMSAYPMQLQPNYGPPQERPMDQTGQVAPPGMKPRVTATLWEDEGTLCFQVDVKGTCVARREDNHMINGTKLLNVAGMTRGRRDGILKSEKQKHVVKIGPMHLKGVWIPYDRALAFANKEKITELLYPLFVSNIGSLLYHPVNRAYPSASASAIPRTHQEPLPPAPFYAPQQDEEMGRNEYRPAPEYRDYRPGGSRTGEYREEYRGRQEYRPTAGGAMAGEQQVPREGDVYS